MRVAFFGDTHGHIHHMYTHAEEWVAEREKERGLSYMFGCFFGPDKKKIGERSGEEIDAIVQVGDFGIYPDHEGLDRATLDHFDRVGEMLLGEYEVDERGDFPHYFNGHVRAPIPTYVVRGNHEDQEYLLAIEKEAAFSAVGVSIARQIFYIPDGAIFSLGKFRVGALGGNYSRKTWNQNKPRREHTGRQRNHIDPTVWKKLMDGDELDILVTHDAPSGIGMMNRRDPGKDGCAQIRQLIEQKVKKYSVSGHWHHRVEAKIGRSNHVALDKVDPSTPRDQGMVIIDLPG